ncbi:cytosine deaminase protein-like protein [Massarina eburnea CBS 473.64]|uniref:Cytosine deaminase protein-like protein n=1 Tax=Massarina eburnea CBS 473.64 TaxID=1395130 RepID=A0A6A6S4N1_9PLEO|nr:cytosine deaminase protein-like protein [Massarina eburnea CBS 473.64]
MPDSPVGTDAASVDKEMAKSRSRIPPPRHSDVYPSSLSKIAGVRLSGKELSTAWDVSIVEGRISSIDQHDPDAAVQLPSHDVLDGANRLLAPSLCHAHIHLDKCFLLQDPKYSDLQMENGDFQEAMDMTGKAKARFGEDDLLRRGRQLIEESIHHGVTAMRAFVEVDGHVQFKCLDAGLQLKEEFEHRCDIQICAFAQLPLFSGNDGGEEVRKLMSAAAQEEGVDVLGSTPYVEADEAKQKMNVCWISTLALSHAKHLDLHLDYFLEEHKQPLVWSVLDIVKDRNWLARQGKQITLGHCTRLTRFKDEEWSKLRQCIADLPVSFVGLPTSDLFMMRTPEGHRGTLPVVDMIHRYGLDAAIGINNVGNAFTPHGNCDPLSIASMGVGIYHAGAKKDAETLYEAVSSRAKAVIGHESTSLGLKVGELADFVLFDGTKSGWRSRKSIAEVVYDPATSRQTIRRGRMTAL